LEISIFVCVSSTWPIGDQLARARRPNRALALRRGRTELLGGVMAPPRAVDPSDDCVEWEEREVPSSGHRIPVNSPWRRASPCVWAHEIGIAAKARKVPTSRRLGFWKGDLRDSAPRAHGFWRGSARILGDRRTHSGRSGAHEFWMMRARASARLGREASVRSLLLKVGECRRWRGRCTGGVCRCRLSSAELRFRWEPINNHARSPSAGRRIQET
jgi:hypothetical protein